MLTPAHCMIESDIYSVAHLFMHSLV